MQEYILRRLNKRKSIDKKIMKIYNAAIKTKERKEKK